MLNFLLCRTVPHIILNHMRLKLAASGCGKRSPALHGMGLALVGSHHFDLNLPVQLSWQSECILGNSISLAYHPKSRDSDILNRRAPIRNPRSTDDQPPGRNQQPAPPTARPTHSEWPSGSTPPCHHPISTHPIPSSIQISPSLITHTRATCTNIWAHNYMGHMQLGSKMIWPASTTNYRPQTSNKNRSKTLVWGQSPVQPRNGLYSGTSIAWIYTLFSHITSFFLKDELY